MMEVVVTRTFLVPITSGPPVVAAVAFGIGGREVAADLIAEWLNKAKSNARSKSGDGED